MKQVLILLLILLLSSFATVVYAEDVLIYHQSYGNTHLKWKNRLEDAGHTVTNVTSFPSNTTSYEMIFDIRYSYNLSSAEETAYKALLTRGGTLYLQGENPHPTLNPRNQNITEFIKDELGGGNIVYNSSTSTGYASNSITTFNTNESFIANHSGSLTFAGGGILTSVGDGTWLAKDSNGNIVAAVWYGSVLDSGYTGKVLVITDINYASHSSYYTNNNKNFMNALRTMLVSTYNTAVSISSSQSTIKSTAQNTSRGSGCNVCITQSGANFTLNVQQAGADNFIKDVDWNGNATITGDSVTVTVKQGNVTTTGDSGNNGLGLLINGNSNNVTVSQGNANNDDGYHRSIIDITGTSNVMNLTQYDGGTLSKHFFSIDIDANSNNITVHQRDNGEKTMFLDVNGNSNTGTFIQEDTGTHYLDVTLSANHTVDITQRGAGNHAARVDLAGYDTDFDLIQQGSSAQSYELDNTCSNSLGCTINTTQGTQ